MPGCATAPPRAPPETGHPAGRGYCAPSGAAGRMGPAQCPCLLRQREFPGRLRNGRFFESLPAMGTLPAPFGERFDAASAACAGRLRRPSTTDDAGSPCPLQDSTNGRGPCLGARGKQAQLAQANGSKINLLLMLVAQMSTHPRAIATHYCSWGSRNFKLTHGALTAFEDLGVVAVAVPRCSRRRPAVSSRRVGS